jgi:uncharacterized protein (TIGR04141 family)
MSGEILGKAKLSNSKRMSVYALLVSRMMSKKSETDWSPIIRGLTGEDEFTAKNEVAAAVLIIPSGEAAFAICYGMGHLLLEQAMLEPAFGLRFAIRSADPEQVRGITRRPLEQRAQINRQTVPGGQTLQAFGIEEYGEVISRLAAKAGADLILTANSGKPKRISFTAGNSLALPLARTPRELLSDLNRINEVLGRPAPEPFDRIEQLQPLGPRDPRRKELNAELCKLLSSGAREHLNLAFPWEREEEYGEEEGFLVYASGKKGVVDELSLDYILELVHQLEPDRIHPPPPRRRPSGGGSARSPKQSVSTTSTPERRSSGTSWRRRPSSTSAASGPPPRPAASSGPSSTA